MEFRSSGGESKTGEPSAGKIKSGGKESSGRKVKLIAEVKDSDTGDNSEKGMCTKVIFIFHKSIADSSTIVQHNYVCSYAISVYHSLCIK